MYNREQSVSLAKAVCAKLNASGLRDVDLVGDHVPFTIKSGVGESLTFLPAERLDRILTYPYVTKDFDSLYEAWGREGMLRFAPYIYESASGPSLVLRHDRFLHTVKGKHFQVSQTEYRLYLTDRSSFNFDWFTCNDLKQYCEESEFIALLLYAVMLDTCYQYRNVREWVEADRGAVTGFLRQSMAQLGIPVKHSWAYIQKYISNECEWNGDTRSIYRVKEDGRPICEFAFGRYTVQVKTTDARGHNKFFTIHVPSADAGLSVKNIEDRDAYVKYYDVITHPDCIKILLPLAMALSGVKINWNNCYSFNKLCTLRCENVPGVLTVCDLNDVRKTKPDMF